MHNITVAIRVKPVQQTFKTIHVNNNVVQLLDPELGVNDPVDILKKNRIKDCQYEFDIVFDQDAEQKDVYNKSTEPLLEDLLSGQNVTIFAYGATGAGKTFTMMGGPGNAIGIIPRALSDLYQKMPKDEQPNLTYLEIYNEVIRDLLTGKTLDLREDGHAGLVVVNLFKAPARTIKEVNQLIQFGDARRVKEPTGANQNSTRSHTVLQIILKNSTLTFVDLAGSERAAKTNNRGQRMLEGAMINRSLLVLGNCIKALFAKGQYVPYRGSKLTRLLKEALAGNSKTVMIANVSPTNYEDSYNTLLYAHRTRNIDPTPDNFSEMINNLRDENENLKKQIIRSDSVMKQELIMDDKAIKQDLEKHFTQEVLLIQQLFQIEDEMFKIQLEIIDLEKSQALQFQKINQEKIDQKNQQSEQLEMQQYDVAVKYKNQLQGRRKLYNACMANTQAIKEEFRKNVQIIEMMKADQNIKRDKAIETFKQLEIQHLRSISETSISQPQNEEKLEEIKKHRLQRLNQQIKEGKL